MAKAGAKVRLNPDIRKEKMIFLHWCLVKSAEALRKRHRVPSGKL
jgi:hypothetical protein